MVKKNDSKKEPAHKGSYRSTTRDQYTVVLKDIRSQFRVFGEGLSYVSDTLDEHTKRFEEIKEHLTNVEVRIVDVEARLTNVETELEFVKEQLSIIRHNQVTRDEFQLLETRVARLEHIKK